MDFLSIVASITKKRPIASNTLTELAELPPFGHSDSIAGTIKVVTETNDPTGPTQPITLDSSSGVALTDGAGVVYANGIIVGIQNNNEIHFTMVVESQALIDALALTTNDYINAFFEARGRYQGQDMLILREPVAIMKAASSSGALAQAPAAVPGVIFNYLITALRGVATSVESQPTIGIATGALLITTIGYAVQIWQMTAGVADPLDLNGKVQALDDPARFWLKVAGL
jgi:hypothetical protein